MTGTGVVWSRPDIHFTPKSGWINDPNGLVVVDGIHHLYYQHNPDAPVWGNIHWGHATSSDLVTWDEQPIALRPDRLGEIFSGSIVVDEDDTAGFGRGAIVAVFTHDADGAQSQSLAYSRDGGTTFRMFDHNPVLTDEATHFRDPKVVRLIGPDGPFWLMVVAVDRELWFYRSNDLRAWVKTQEYAPPSPWPAAMLEVPDLVQVDDPSGRAQWVLMYSVDTKSEMPAAPRHVRYLRGDFDDSTFIAVGPDAHLDGGPHAYAAMTWTRPGRRPALTAWMNEAEVAIDQRSPATPWCGRQTTVRELVLDRSGRLEQHPILPAPTTFSHRQRLDATTGAIVVPSHCFTLTFHGTTKRCTITLEGMAGTTTIDITDSQLGISSHAGVFATGTTAAVEGALVVVDAGSVEVFSGDRVGSISALTGAGQGATKISAETADLYNFAIEVVELGAER